MEDEFETTLTFSPGTAIWLACCVGFGLNIGWNALDAVGHILGRLMLLAWG